MAVRWSIAGQQQPALRDVPFFSRILSAVGDSRKRAGAAQQPRHELERAAPSDRNDLLMEYVERLVVKILGLQASRRLDPRAGFKDLGLDSLLALELRNALQDAFGLTLPQGVSFNHPNLEAMTQYLLNRVFPDEPQLSAFAYEASDVGLPLSSPAASPAAATPSEGTASVTLESLDASEIERLLQSELAGTNPTDADRKRRN
jgi:polyketide synthase 12/polyene macrolide polyketide synthase/epothilone polyketide synthase D